MGIGSQFQQHEVLLKRKRPTGIRGQCNPDLVIGFAWAPACNGAQRQTVRLRTTRASATRAAVVNSMVTVKRAFGG